MKFWTYQSYESVAKLEKDGFIQPNFFDDNYRSAADLNTYRLIARIYREMYNLHKVNGLVFGVVGNSNHESIESVDEFYDILREERMCCGIVIEPDTHVLLELDIPDDMIKIMPVMGIDFYRFSDLLFYMEESNGSLDDCDVKNCIKYLFEPNNSDGTYQLIQGHIPYIKNEWVVNKYKNVPKDILAEL